MTGTAARWVAVLAVCLLGFGACGADEEDPYAVPDRFEDYCEEVEEQQVPISDALAEGGETTGLIEALPSFEALAEKAPDDIDDEWDVVVGRIRDLVGAFEAAGVDPTTYDRREPPAGLGPAEKDAIDAAARALVSAATAAAMQGVQQQARDVCKTPLAIG